MTDELDRCTAGRHGRAAGEAARSCPSCARSSIATVFRTPVQGATPGRGTFAIPSSPPLVALSKPVDLDQLRTIVGDDRDFMNELCETFVASSTRIVEELTRALSAGIAPA